jgi:phosphoribosylanthranilate isomerase
MLRPIEIKICGMTCEEDVDLALVEGADFLGFIVYPGSPRALTIERAIELASRVPIGKRVVVDVETSPEALKRYREAGFDFFQIHSKSSTGLPHLPEWSEIVGRECLWLAPRLAPSDVFPESIVEFADTILLDTYSKQGIGGTGHTGDWLRFKELQQQYAFTQWVIAGGLSPENVVAAISGSAATRIDVNSGVESRPGKKDPEKLRELFRVLRS